MQVLAGLQLDRETVKRAPFCLGEYVANIYAVYCTVKQVLFKYKLVKCVIFKENLKHLR